MQQTAMARGICIASLRVIAAAAVAAAAALTAAALQQAAAGHLEECSKGQATSASHSLESLAGPLLPRQSEDTHMLAV